MASLTIWIAGGSGKEEICPVLDDPDPDCYCLNLTSVNIPMAIHFCLRDFRECPIYNRYLGYPEF